MGLTDDLGVNIPKIDITGLVSNTWVYVFIIVILGIILIGVAVAVFFYFTYNRKIVLFENVAGQGYQVCLKTRARIVKLGSGGEELLKTFIGGHYVSAYGKKMGKNTYWYAKAQDGYWYNILLGDLDAKRGMLDIEPVDRDVRMFHVALDRLSHLTYGKTSFMEKYGSMMLAFIFLIALVGGLWFLIGQIGTAVAPLAESVKLSQEVQEKNLQVTERLEGLVSSIGGMNLNQKPANVGLEPAE